jgi:hypothetical protein
VPETVRQAPGLVGSLQAWHWPSQALLQQTPSTQWPLMQSGPFAHAAPVDAKAGLSGGPASGISVSSACESGMVVTWSEATSEDTSGRGPGSSAVTSGGDPSPDGPASVASWRSAQALLVLMMAMTIRSVPVRFVMSALSVVRTSRGSPTATGRRRGRSPARYDGHPSRMAWR